MSEILELEQSLLHNHTTDQSLHTPEQEIMDSVSFQLLLDQQRIELNRKKVIIDQVIKITNLIELRGYQSLLKFMGGSLVFCGNDNFEQMDEFCIIEGFQIEVNQSTPCIYTQNRNIQLMACNIEINLKNENLIDFDNSLNINDTTIKGFAQITNCHYNSCKIYITNSTIECDTSTTLIQYNSIDNCYLNIENSKFEGGFRIIQFQNCSNISIILLNNEFINQNITLQLENIMNKEIIIKGNLFIKAQDQAIKMKDIIIENFVFQNNNISRCKIGMQLQNIVQISQLFKSIQSIKIKQNIISNIEQSALIIKEVICLEIDTIQIVGNTIGIELDLSTNKPKQQDNINPYIISISNSNINSNRIHGIFINSNLERNSIFFQISRTVFNSNCNAISLSHQGEQRNNRLKINIHNCQFFDKNLCNQNPNYDITFTKVNQQNQTKKIKQNTCQIM